MDAKSVESTADKRLAKVELTDGTVLLRISDDRWIANPDHKRRTEWIGDIVYEKGTLHFLYKYPKAYSQCVLDLRFQDGSRLAVSKQNGPLSYPSKPNQLSSRTLEENAVASIEELNAPLYESGKRLKMSATVVQDGIISFVFLLHLNSSEERVIKQALQKLDANSGTHATKFVIAESSVELSYSGGCSVIADPEQKSANSKFAYSYAEPRPDHTASAAIFFVDSKTNRLKVVTGVRAGEPYKGKEALPGGFINISSEKIESANDAARREIKEETGGEVKNLSFLRLSDARKDPRNQVIDAQFLAYMSASDFAKMSASDDLAQLHPRDVVELLEAPDSLAFDHFELLHAALHGAKNLPALKLTAYNTAREMEFNKAIRTEVARAEARRRPEVKDDPQDFSPVLVQLLKLLKELPFGSSQPSTDALKNEMRKIMPSIQEKDADYLQVRLKQILYEEVDYSLSKNGWIAPSVMIGDDSEGAAAGKGAPFRPEGLEQDIAIPADVTLALSFILELKELSPVDRRTIQSLDKVLHSDDEQKLLLENGYKKAMAKATSTKPSIIIAFLLSYCGKKPEDIGINPP